MKYGIYNTQIIQHALRAFDFLMKPTDSKTFPQFADMIEGYSQSQQAAECCRVLRIFPAGTITRKCFNSKANY